MSRLPNMEYRAEFLRGWPNQLNIQSNLPAVSEDIQIGDLVLVTADQKIKKCDVADSSNVGIVVRGPADDWSAKTAGGVASGTGRNVAGGGMISIVLWGNYKVRTVGFDKAQTYVPGDFVTANDKGEFTKGTRENHVGFVEAVDTLGNGDKALVIVVR